MYTNKIVDGTSKTYTASFKVLLFPFLPPDKVKTGGGQAAGEGTRGSF